MKRMVKTRRREPTIALINIVFLILIFFMVAGSIDTQAGLSIAAIRTDGLDCCVPPNAVSVSADGTVRFRGETLDGFADYVTSLDPEARVARVLPDRALPAAELLSIVEQLRAAGADRVVILTEQRAQ